MSLSVEIRLLYAIINNFGFIHIILQLTRKDSRAIDHNIHISDIFQHYIHKPVNDEFCF
jgi:hypothetical protein